MDTSLNGKAVQISVTFDEGQALLKSKYLPDILRQRLIEGLSKAMTPKYTRYCHFCFHHNQLPCKGHK